MSSIMDWVKNTIGITDEEEAINEKETTFEPTPISSRPRRNVYDDIPVSSASSRRSKVLNINTTTQIKVVVLQPLSYNDVPEIAEHLKAKKPVVVNLEKVDASVATRIIDFLSGTVVALDGNMQKVSKQILLVVPNTVGIMGEFSDDLKTQGLFDAF
ncbi:MAG: cell division protein SepF [Clostridia bacterium]|nr:cell division protein SepF [Clostridia bacterium]